MRRLRKFDFVVKIDLTGVKFVLKVVDEFIKNYREDDEAKKGGIMLLEVRFVLLYFLKSICSI